MPSPIASRTSSRRVSAWTRAATARSSTRSATPIEMHPGLRARFRMSVRHGAEETGSRLDRDDPAAPRLDLRRRLPQGARRLPAATRSIKVAATKGIHTTGTGAVAGPGKTARRRRTCTRAAARGHLFKSRHRLTPGSGSQPPVPRCIQPAAHPGSTAPPSASTFGRGGYPDAHDALAWCRARPGPACRAAVRLRRRTRMRGSPGAHLVGSAQQVGEVFGRQVEHAGVAAALSRPGPQGEAAERLPTENPPHGQAHGGLLYQALTALRRQGDTPCPLSSPSQSGRRPLTMPCSATHPSGAVAGCRSQGSATTRSRPHADGRGHRDGGRCPDLQEDAPAPQGGARRWGGHL